MAAPEAICPHLDRCGLCTEMRLAVEERHERKVARVAAMLRRTPDAFVASPREVGYRARITVHPAGSAWGYHRPRTHEPIAVPSCTIARPEVDAVLQQLPAGGKDGVELRSDGERVAVVALGARPPPSGWCEAVAGLPGVVGVAHRDRRISGAPALGLVFGGGLRVQIGPTTFYQVNLELNARLVDAVVGRVAERSPHAVLDLFAGAGNFTLPLAARGIAVTAIEAAQGAVHDLERALREHRLHGCQVRHGDANRLRPGELFFDVAIVDPPRSGAPGLLERLVVTRPRTIVYVSCNARTLGRDLEPILRTGYRLTELAVFDMFPQTEHAEVLAVVDRTG